MKLYRWLESHPAWLLVGLALALRIVPAMVRFVIGSDDGLFLTLGQNLVAGRGYTGDGVTVQIDFPPGYPLFAAAVYGLGGGLELPTLLNMVVIGALLSLPIYWLTRQLTDARTALIAGLLTALHPALVLAQGNFESVAEQPYALLLYTGWGLLWLGMMRRRLWAFGLAGLLIGMAHLVRWEGVILGIVAAGIIGLMLRRHSLLPLLAFLTGLALFAVPYGLFLYRHTGSVLSPKTMLTQLHAAAIDATASDPYAFERSFFEHYETWLADPRQPPQVVQESRTAALQRYLGNVLYQGRLWLTAFSFMTLLWIVPFFIGLATMGRRQTLFLLPLFIPLAAIPASVVDPRYFLIPLPVMMIFAAQGWSWLTRRFPHPQISLPPNLKSHIPHPTSHISHPKSRFTHHSSLITHHSSRITHPVSLVTLLLTLTLTLFTLAGLTGPFLYPRPTGYRAAGLTLRNQIPPGAHILARKRQIPFYAGGVWEWLPFADLNGVLTYADSHNADYLVVDRFTTPSLRPQLVDLLDPANAPKNLMPIYVDEQAGVVVYRIGH